MFRRYNNSTRPPIDHKPHPTDILKIEKVLFDAGISNDDLRMYLDYQEKIQKRIDSNPILATTQRGNDLIVAVKSGKANVVAQMLEKDNSIVNFQEDMGYNQTALMYAAVNNNLYIAAELLRNGADPDIKDINWRTALMHATISGNREIVDKLVRSGADVDLRDISGYTALIMASILGRLEIVRSLIQGGSDINIKDDSGMTALMWATEKNHAEVVRELLRDGADINIKDRERHTALDYVNSNVVQDLFIDHMDKTQH